MYERNEGYSLKKRPARQVCTSTCTLCHFERSRSQTPLAGTNRVLASRATTSHARYRNVLAKNIFMTIVLPIEAFDQSTKSTAVKVLCIVKQDVIDSVSSHCPSDACPPCGTTPICIAYTVDCCSCNVLSSTT